MLLVSEPELRLQAFQTQEWIQFFPLFARHGRALTGVSPEHAQVVGNV